jgi:hypothetical protein
LYRLRLLPDSAGLKMGEKMDNRNQACRNCRFYSHIARQCAMTRGDRDEWDTCVSYEGKEQG